MTPCHVLPLDLREWMVVGKGLLTHRKFQAFPDAGPGAEITRTHFPAERIQPGLMIGLRFKLLEPSLFFVLGKTGAKITA